MSRLHDLHAEQGQSPWLDNLRRGWITSGELQGWIDRGVRGLTSNPTIFAKAMTETDDYDADLSSLVASGSSIDDAYWQLVMSDIRQALDLLAPIHASSDGQDGHVSVEVAPALAHQSDATLAAARHLGDQLAAPNLMVKVPGTAEGVTAVEALFAEGRSINVTLIFGIDRYRAVMEAYLRGLEACEHDLSPVASVASFFVSRVDVEVDRRLTEIGSANALSLRGKAAIAQARLAYQAFTETFSGPRWDALVARGARPQRPLWASTSTKDPSYPDTLYVDQLIGPGTVNTLPEATLAAFDDHGALARTIDAGLDDARSLVDELGSLGIDMNEVATKLEAEGVASFAKSFDDVLASLGQRAGEVGAG